MGGVRVQMVVVYMWLCTLGCESYPTLRNLGAHTEDHMCTLLVGFGCVSLAVREFAVVPGCSNLGGWLSYE